ncbi:MAG: adenylate/guanylate cyclase domain-containing protein [Desulfamplus sp.]|nr:adenylate/guanylate cyclase domain-containing protein [Desulfamplus sp.]
MDEKYITASQFAIFRKNYLSVQAKYEEKIGELSIIKEMNTTMQQIDHIDQDLIWIRHLECIKKYKNLAAAVLYFSTHNAIKRDHFFYTDFEEPFDCTSFKNISFFKKILLEKTTVVIDSLDEPYLFNDLSYSFYGQPILSGGKVIAVLMLFSRHKKAFEQSNQFFYTIVCEHLYNHILFLRLYYGKLDEEKQMIQLSRFFSKNVIAEIFKRGQLKLGGEKKQVAVMFVDLKGFTRLSENMEPEDVVTLLNRFFSYMIPIIFRHKGTLDKLLGDGIMAVFGSPIEDTESCLNAVKAALEMFTVLNTFNRDLQHAQNSLRTQNVMSHRKSFVEAGDFSDINVDIEPSTDINNILVEGNIEIVSGIERGSIEMVSGIEMRREFEIKNGLEMGIGINYGELVAGFMGSEQHLNYTVVGDVVNAAQRIQSLAGSNEIFLSGSVYDKIDNHLENLENLENVTRLNDVKLKGKEKMVSLYRLKPILK